MIDSKEVIIEYEGEEYKYNISKFPATVGREIIALEILLQARELESRACIGGVRLQQPPKLVSRPVESSGLVFGHGRLVLAVFALVPEFALLGVVTRCYPRQDHQHRHRLRHLLHLHRRPPRRIRPAYHL